MHFLPANIGDVRPLPVVRVAFTYFVVYIIATGIAVHEIVVLFHSILVTPS